ncbi:MAG: DEAD/DEAH box helicase [Bacteroidota bacterium]
MKKNKNIRRHKNRFRGKPKKKKDTSALDISKFTNKNIAPESNNFQSKMNSFSGLNLHSTLLDRIQQAGYKQPTEIQEKSIKPILAGRDIIGIAGTGTGKTAAFLIPVIQKLIKNRKDLNTLIVTPTRELANQISEEFKKLSRKMSLFTSTLIGGTNVNQSIKALKRTNHVVIATPGRLIDMIKQGYLDPSQFSTLILDEFDRMLDMGFLRDVLYINNEMIGKDQTLLFSATLDPTQKKIIAEITNNPLEIKAGPGTHATKAIEQEVVHIPKGENKINVLYDLLSEYKNEKVLLFCETKWLVKKVCKKLEKKGVKVDMIHGNKSQNARETALRKFKAGKIDLLVATDVIARGIDVTDISLVINFDIPRDYNNYIHRIGRTGRAGKLGKALTLVA